MSKVYHFTKTQLLPCSLEKAWDFFSDPSKLPEITPPNMKFKVRSEKQSRMYAGQIVEYTVRPVLSIPLYWMTEITHVKEKEFFVDEQRFGPYTLWHHQHHFREVPGGTEMTDIVHYKLPMWFFGDIANWLFVKKQLNGIFAFRLKKTEEIFT